MEDLPIPETGGEAIGILVVVAILAGLYLLVRSTLREHDRRYWERRRFLTEHRLAEPEDPSQLPSRWERIDDDEGDAGVAGSG